MVKFRFVSRIMLLFLLSCSSLAAQHNSEIIINRAKTDAYKIVERSDWSRYENGKYIGLLHREVRAILYPADTGRALLYQGNFYVLEETLRDMRQSARAVNDVIPVSFEMFPSGDIQIEDDRGFPSLRGFPAYPEEPVQPGTKWIAEAVRLADPLNEGYPVAVPIVVEYEYRGIEIYRDVQVHRITAQYASRFPGFSQEDSRENLWEKYADERYFKTLQGNHQVEILLRLSDGLPLLIRDNLDETFTWANGYTLRFRGFTLTFSEGAVPLDTDQVAAAVPAKETSIELAAVPGGIRLTVKDIRFIADSDVFLADEYPRLDKIAEALKKIPDRTFLVEGHTAAVGRPQAEMELSILRAKRMADELIKRGVSAGSFLYKGWGGTRPLGDNSTEEGRALNRRVEITILD
ncbi:MAG: OmpA family protein [Treponema sp.]|nr:OmpA family protein [Treponema sp.]